MRWFDRICSDLGVEPELALIGLVWTIWFYLIVVIGIALSQS